MTRTPPPSPPAGVDVLSASDGTLLRRKWFGRWRFLPLCFAAAWDLYAFFFYRLIVGLGPVPAVAMFLPVAGAVLAVIATYAAFAAVWNRTEITISTQGIKVHIGPLPWPGNKIIPAARIGGVKVVSRYAGRGGWIRRVLYLDAQRRERPLLKQAATLEWATFVAATVRWHLHLPPPAG